MLFDSKPYTFDRVIRIAITAGIIWCLVQLLGYLSDVLIPFAIALLLAYMVNPLVMYVQKKIPNRLAAVFISIFIIIALFTGILWLIIPMIISEFNNMGRILSELLNNSEISETATRWLPPDIWQAVKNYTAKQDIQELFKTENFWKVVEAVSQKVLPGMWGLMTGATTFIMTLLGLTITGLYFVFLLIDYQKISDGWKELIPSAYRKQIVGFVVDFETAMNRYFRGQAAVASIVGVLFAVGFSIIGLPLGIILGLFIGMLNMVPYLQLIAIVPAFLIALVSALETGTGLWIMLGLTGSVFIVVQIIEDTVLIPKIMGKVTGMNPAMILLSLSIWGKLLGVLGLIIALPMTFLILAYYRRFLAKPSIDKGTDSDSEQ